MKVIHLVPAMEQGGVESVVVQLTRSLVQAGVESVVVSRGGRLAAEVERAGGRHVALELKSKNPLTFFSRALALRRFLRAERAARPVVAPYQAARADILVCAHSRVPAWLFRFANRALGLPWLTYAHGANSVSRYSAVMTKGARTVVPSRYLADYLKNAYALPADRLRVIPNAVDGARFDPARLDRAFAEERRRDWGLAGKRVVMAVGRLTPLKGYDTLIRAFALLPDRANLRLVIVGGADRGKEDYLASLRRLAAELVPEPGAVVFAGAQEKVAECLALADVVVSSNTVKPETFGLSMAEALTMDRPVVAKAFGGALDVVRDGVDGVLVPNGTPAEFAAAIRRVLEGDFTGMRESARARFDPAVTAEATMRLYREVLAESGKGGKS